MSVKKVTAAPHPVKDEKSGDKLIYKISEVSRMTQVDAETLESWESEFPFLMSGRTGSGQKFFRQQDVAIIRRIRELRDSKTLTMAGIKRRIEDEFGLARANPVHPEKMRKALHSVRDGLQEIVSSLDKGRKKKS
jgi:DNA-binding transcriptional MerR regulator